MSFHCIRSLLLFAICSLAFTNIFDALIPRRAEQVLLFGKPETTDPTLAPTIGGPPSLEPTAVHHPSSEPPTSVPTRPPLSSLIQDARMKYITGNDTKRSQKVIGDPQFLLDFAIVGFPKCGTTALSKWLGTHPDVKIRGMEMQYLAYSKPATAIWELYTILPEGNFTRGYKSPFDVTNRGGAMDYIRKLFPNTKLIVGVRHPIRWFESFYNYRLLDKANMPSAESLRKRSHYFFSVKEASFHVSLAKLGKTSLNSTLERKMKRHFKRKFHKLSPPIPNDVFLYDMEQFSDQNATRITQFRQDVQHYLGLKHDITPIEKANEGKVKPAAKGDFIDICDNKYKRVRRDLLKISRQASTWIRESFLDGNGVYMSNREHLEEILGKWMVDPCIERTAKRDAIEAPTLTSSA